MIRATTDATLLGAALKDAAMQSKDPLSILQHVLIRTCEDGLFVQSTDLEQRVSAVIPATIESHGAVCPHGAKLRAAMTSGGEIRLEQDEVGHSLTVRRGARSRLRVDTLPADSWPVAENMTWTDAAFTGEQLAKAIDAVAYASAKDDVRPYCNAVCIGPRLIFATNGNRCAMLDFHHDGRDTLIPIRAVPAMRKHLVDGARVQFGGHGKALPVSMAVDKGGNRIEVSLMPSQRLPDIIAVVPIKDPACTFTAKRAELLECIERAAPFCERVIDKGRFTHARVGYSGNELRLENFDGTSHEIIEVSGTGMINAGVELGYLATTLYAIDADEVTIEIHGDGNSWTTFVLRTGKADATHVVMGVRT